MPAGQALARSILYSYFDPGHCRCLSIGQKCAREGFSYSLNGKYYFLVNINRDIKLRHVLENVTITGELDKKFDSITVMEFKAMQNSKERTIWSQEMEDAEFNRLYNSG